MAELFGLSYEDFLARFDWTNLYGEDSAPSAACAVEDRHRAASAHHRGPIAAPYVGKPAARLAMLTASSLLPAATRSSDHSRHTAAASRSMLEAVRASNARSKL